ncbi:ABC transporter permease [Streptomyces sp. NPDC001591]|uniref:ABC transporter permease n=1 Tax=Streptomyces sp. NPDC001591 TaxID=3364589 RepID=UPI0036CD2E07
MAGLEEQYAHLPALLDSYGLSTDARSAVTESYEVFRKFHGPFITSIAAQMLPDLRADADQGRVIVFLGRDGHSFAAATRALAPDFFTDHCREVVLSRVVAETALQDLERNRGASFPDVEGFRGTRGRVAEEDITGSYRQLTAYLRGAGIPAGRAGSRVTLVDSSFKGTVQELLSAAYERTDFQGRYAFLGAAPDDPRPERKHGYVVHLRAEQTGEGKGYPFDDIHPDVAWTFASKEPINVIEDSLNGPLDTPLGITGAGPRQRLQRDDPASFRGFNPLLVPQRFRDPVTREAIKAAALLAVYDAAAERAQGQAAPDWLSRRMQERAEFTTAVRQWTERSPGVDPALKTVLDSIVRRVDHPAYSTLQDHFAKRGLSEEQAAAVWMHMEQLPNRKARAAFVQETIQQPTDSAAIGRTAGSPQTRRPDPKAARARSTTTREPAPKRNPDAAPGQDRGPHQPPPERRRGRGK